MLCSSLHSSSDEILQANPNGKHTLTLLSKLLCCSRLLSCTLPHQSQTPIRPFVWHCCLQSMLMVNCRLLRCCVTAVSRPLLMRRMPMSMQNCRGGATHPTHLEPSERMLCLVWTAESGRESCGACAIRQNETHDLCQASFDLTGLARQLHTCGNNSQKRPRSQASAADQCSMFHAAALASWGHMQSCCHGMR